MAKVAITEQYLTDIANAIRTKTGLSTTYYPSQMANAILSISGGGGITPTGTISITENGTYNVTNYASASVNVPTGSTINNQDKTVSPTTSQQSITYDSGYTGLGTVTINAMPTMTLPTAATSSAASGYTSKATIGRSTSDQYINIPTGYNSTGGYYKISAVANGSATGPSSLSGSSATVTTGTNTITLTKTGVTTTPTVSAGYVSSATASTATVALTASVTTKAAATITPGTTNQTIASGTYLTGTQTISGSSNLVASNIKKNVTIFGVTGTYEAGGSSPTIESLSITPSESEQTFNASGVDGYKPVTVGAISSTYVGSGITSRSSTDLTVSGATVTAPAGYYASAASKSVSSMTLPTSAASSATSGYTSKATIGRSTSAQYINIPPGYNSAGAYYTISAVANGSATAPTSISGTSATVSTGTNTLTFTKTVSVTPVVSAGYISSGTATNSSVSLTASVTTKAAATYHPSTTAQSIAASTYLTGIQTINAVTTTNLTAANIKKDVVVKIGDSSDDDCVVSITGTYEGSGGGLTVATSTVTLSSTQGFIQFEDLLGQPTSFVVIAQNGITTGSPSRCAACVFDGTNLFGQNITNTSNAQVSYSSGSLNMSCSGGTLTISSSGADFQAIEYKLVYTYGGSDISTADVQVGSGATSITFTGLEEEPSYFSCVFKSNFSTSSGYQRVIAVVYDGTDTYGMEMDSSAKYSDAHWSYSYSNGSLTITSSGTNAGGYFHQPGYYQLTYAVEGSSGNYQSKTVYATSSQQVITADSAYDALKQVTIPAVTTTNLSASNVINGITIQVGDAADSDRIASVTGNVVLQNYYTGSSAPSSATGSNGDLYLQT